MIKLSISDPLYISSIEEIVKIKVNPRTGERVDPNVPKADPTETATSETSKKPDPETTQVIPNVYKELITPLDPAVEIAKKAEADKKAAYAVSASEIPATSSATATATAASATPPAAKMPSGGTPPATVVGNTMSKGGVRIGVDKALGGKGALGKPRITGLTQVSKAERPKDIPPPNPYFPKETDTEQIDVIQKGYAEREKEVKINAQNIKASQKSIERHQRNQEKKKIVFDRAFKRAETDQERAANKGTKQAWKGFDKDTATDAKAQADYANFTADQENQAKTAKDQEAEMWAAHKTSQVKSAEGEKKTAWSAKTAKEQDAERVKSAREMGHKAAEVAQQKNKARAEKRAMVDNPTLAPPPPVDPADVAADLSARGKELAGEKEAQNKRVFNRVVGVEKTRLQGILNQTRSREKALRRDIKYTRMGRRAGRHFTSALGAIIQRTGTLGTNVTNKMAQPSSVSFSFRNH